MTHEVPRIGTDGQPLPVMPPERDPRLAIRVIRVMFYTPGFLALLLLKAGEPTGFGATNRNMRMFSAFLAPAMASTIGLAVWTRQSPGGRRWRPCLRAAASASAA